MHIYIYIYIMGWKLSWKRFYTKIKGTEALKTIWLNLICGIHVLTWGLCPKDHCCCSTLLPCSIKHYTVILAVKNTPQKKLRIFNAGKNTTGFYGIWKVSWKAESVTCWTATAESAKMLAVKRNERRCRDQE